MTDLYFEEENDEIEVTFSSPSSSDYEEQVYIVFELFEHLFSETPEYGCESRTSWFENFKDYIENNNLREEMMSKDEMIFYQENCFDFKVALECGAV